MIARLRQNIQPERAPCAEEATPAGCILRQASAALTALVVDALQASGPGESKVHVVLQQAMVAVDGVAARPRSRSAAVSSAQTFSRTASENSAASAPREDDRRGAAHLLRYRQARPQPGQRNRPLAKGRAEMPETPLEQYT